MKSTGKIGGQQTLEYGLHLSVCPWPGFCQCQTAVMDPSISQPKKALIFTMKLWKLGLFTQIRLKKATTPAILGKTLPH
jgi:hypothetical protein